ncbi:MAG: hypothetical protein FWG16_08705 [Micrococcales bacterium]|nr:hypothetical protein [Micrococcales bacterium]
MPPVAAASPAGPPTQTVAMPPPLGQPPSQPGPYPPPGAYGQPFGAPYKPKGQWILPYRIIAAVLAVALLAAGIYGLIRNKDSQAATESRLLISGEVSEGNPTLVANGVGITVNPIAVTRAHQAEIRQVSNAPLLDDTVVTAYDFSLDGVDQFEAGVVELTIPLALAADQIPGAAWWNETAQAWEPVYYMYQDGTATIITDHLSTYAVFATDGSGRYAKARYLYGGLWDAQDNYSLAAATSIVQELSATSSFSEVMQALERQETASTFGLAGSVFETINARYPSEQMEKIGYGMAVVSVVIALQKLHQAQKMGDSLAFREAVGSMAMDVTSFAIGEVFGGAAVSAAFHAASIVGYSLDLLKQQQLNIQQDAHYRAYSKYYAPGSKNYRSMPTWYNTFYQAALTRNGQEWQQWVTQEIDRYVNQFWNDDSGDREILLQEQGLASTYGWLDNSARILSEDLKLTLYRQFQECSLWDRIADKVLIEMVSRADQKMIALQDVLNQKVWVQYQTGENYDGTVAVICGETGPDWLETALGWSGKFDVSFTMWAHIQAGGPGTVDVRDGQGTVLLTVALPTLHPGLNTPDLVLLPDLFERDEEGDEEDPVPETEPADEAVWQLSDTRIDDTTDPRWINNWTWDLSGRSLRYGPPDGNANPHEVQASWTIPETLTSDQAFSMDIEVLATGSTGGNKPLWFDISPGPLNSKEVNFSVPCDSGVTLVASAPGDLDTITYRLTIWTTNNFFIYIDYVYTLQQ